MSILRRIANPRIALTLLVLAVLILVYASTSSTTEAVGGPNVCTYYSDARYKTAVGARGTGCCGSTISWGVTTAYKKCQTIYCTDVLCPN